MRFRHLKRGTLYTILDNRHCPVQFQEGDEAVCYYDDIPIRVNIQGDVGPEELMVLYHGEDFIYWGRAAPEFFDGRFERVE